MTARGVDEFVLWDRMSAVRPRTIVTLSLLHPHAQGKKALDTIFSTNAAAQAAARDLGPDAVINASVGSFLNEDEVLAVLPTVERVYKDLSPVATSAYAPFKGMPTFLESIKDMVFGEHIPDGYIEGVATPGGTGAIRHAFFNFTGRSEMVLSGDWFWGPYATICRRESAGARHL